MSILNNYQVKFIMRNSHGKQVKSLNTSNTWLSALITEYYTIDRINDILSEINGVLNGIYPLAGGVTQSLYLSRITIIETKIYQDLEAWEQNNNIQPDFVLPTSHFKVILEAWKEFLQS